MKRATIASFAIITALAAILTSSPYAAQETAVIISFHEEQFLFNQIKEFDQVHLIDGSYLVRQGEPVMPASHILVAIPTGHEATGIRARSLATQDLPGTYSIFPGQPAMPFDFSTAPAFVEPDQKIYSSTQAYPGQLAELTGQTDLAGQQMVTVAVYPLQYTPSSGQLTLHQEIEILIEARPGRTSGESYARFTENQRRLYEETVRGMVVNPEDVVLAPQMRSPSKALPAGDFDHVVVTSSSYASYLDDLVTWHNKRGLRDTVVTTDYIYANYSGSTDQQKIRNFVIDAAGTWGTMYFLMGGEESTVPFEYRTYYDDSSTPSDQYYADYDDDWTCEVYVGRITGGSSTQFDCAIDKILYYEKTPPTSGYPLDVLLIGMDLNASTPAEDLKETIDGYIPAEFTVTKVYDSDATNHRTDAINALNAGQNLVNHADHANSTVMGLGNINHNWNLWNADVHNLVNDGQPSNVVSLGCWPNDMPYNDCIAECFVIYNANQAGVSFTGNTRDGWGYVGQPASLSGQLDRDWWRGLFNYSQYLLGHALVWSKHQFSHSANVNKHCEWTFSLLGDPAMPLWTATPATLTVSHLDTIPVASSSFTVHVESGGSDVLSAYVCLWKQGEVYLTGSTNGDGDVTFTPDPSSTGIMYVTVTKHNYLPYEGNAQVIPGGPPPTITNLGIALSQGDLVLTWSPPGAKAISRYVIYRDTQPDFVPAPEDSIGGTVDTTFTDVGAAGIIGTDYYYVVKAVDDYGQKSEPSDPVGEYNIGLINEPPTK